MEELLGISVQAAPLLEFHDRAWRPDFGSMPESVAVHFCDTPELGSSIERRMIAALAQDYRVVAVLPLGLINLAQSTQEFLIRHPIEVVSPKENGTGWQVLADCVKQLVQEGVLLDSEVASRLLIEKLNSATLNVSDGKGALLEQALSLACSQVPGWRVRDTNFKTANEELDLVVANNSAKAPWNGTAFIIVEAKNWSHNVDRVEYDALHMKVAERGGSCRLGLFVAATGFSSGFYERASHHGVTHFSIVPMTVGWLVRQLERGRPIEEALGNRVENVVLDRKWQEDGLRQGS